MVKELSPIKRTALLVLDKIKSLIIDNECSDDEISDALVKFHPSSHEEYINPSEYMNYDEACKELHLGHNRGKLNSMCKKYGIVNYTVKNRPMGFKRKEILSLKKRMNDI